MGLKCWVESETWGTPQVHSGTICCILKETDLGAAKGMQTSDFGLIKTHT